MAFQLVPKHPACISGATGVALTSHYHNMVKFKDAEDEGFRRVNGELSIMLKRVVRKLEEGQEELPVASGSHSGR